MEILDSLFETCENHNLGFLVDADEKGITLARTQHIKKMKFTF